MRITSNKNENDINNLNNNSNSISPLTKNKTLIEKSSGLVGGFFDLFDKSLSNERIASNKLLTANREWVYRNNDVIAKEVATIEFKLYQTKVSEGEIELEEVTSHPLLNTLDRFNDVTTKSDAIYSTQSHRKLVGDAFWLFDGIPPNIKNIYVLTPTKVEVKPSDFNKTNKPLIDAYVYEDIINGKKVTKTYKPEEILHFKVPNPNNMFRGLGAVEAALTTIDLDNLTTAVNLNFFEQGAITNFVLTTDQRISPDDRKRMRAELRSNYGGFKNAFKAMILGGGLKAESIRMSNKDMEFLAQLEWYRDKIMVLFGNTKASLGIVEDVNRSNAESTINLWRNNTVQPEMAAICDTINEFLVPLYGDNLILGFEEITSEDRMMKVDEIVKLKEASIINQNEAREALDYDEVEGGDEFYRPPEPIRIDPDDEKTIPDDLKHINLKRYLRRMKIGEQIFRYKQDQAIRDTAKKLAKDFVTKKHQAVVKDSPAITNPSFSEEQIKTFYYKLMAVVDEQEIRVQNAAYQLSESLVEEGLANIDKEDARKSGELVDKDRFNDRALSKMTPLLTEVAVTAGNEAYDLIDIDKPYLPKAFEGETKDFDVRAFIRNQILLFAGSMLTTDVDIMTSILLEGIKEGKGVAEVKREIREKFFGKGKEAQLQAERIARTETIKTLNAGTQDAYMQSGVVEAKEWLAIFDARVCPECEKMNGAIVDVSGDYDAIIKSQLGTKYHERLFSYGGRTQYPPLHTACRCTIAPVLIGTKSAVGQRLDKIVDLEAQIDKRTKEYRNLKEQNLADKEYIEALERLLGVTSDGQE